MNFIKVTDFDGKEHMLNANHIVSVCPTTCGDAPAVAVETVSTVYTVKEDMDDIGTQISFMGGRF